MKIRKGFVSNSSSSCFVLTQDDFPNTFQIAMHMIANRGKTWDSTDSYRSNATDMKVHRKIHATLTTMGPNNPIAFTSGSYPTYIVSVDDQFIVRTCNHNNWELGDQIISYFRPVGYFEDLGLTELEDIDGVLEFLFDFWWPEFDVIGRSFFAEIIDDENCTTHRYQRMIIERDTGRMICPTCTALRRKKK